MVNNFKTIEKEKLFEELVKRLKLKDFNKPMVDFDKTKMLENYLLISIQNITIIHFKL